MDDIEKLHTEINKMYDDKPRKISYFDFANSLIGYSLYNKQDGKAVSKWEAYDPKNPDCAEMIIAGTHLTISAKKKYQQSINIE